MADLSRRDAIKVLSAAAGAVGIAAIPEVWQSPSVEASTLPRVLSASTIVLFSENVDGVTAPSLPSGWASSPLQD